jgi:hypothetical protein
MAGGVHGRHASRQASQRSRVRQADKSRKAWVSSENLPAAENAYVGWLDLMGAGHMMSTSVHKTANFLVRLHMSVEIARRESGYMVDALPINDGIFIVSKKKRRTDDHRAAHDGASRRALHCHAPSAR